MIDQRSLLPIPFTYGADDLFAVSPATFPLTHFFGQCSGIEV